MVLVVHIINDEITLVGAQRRLVSGMGINNETGITSCMFYYTPPGMSGGVSFDTYRGGVTPDVPGLGPNDILTTRSPCQALAEPLCDSGFERLPWCGL